MKRLINLTEFELLQIQAEDILAQFRRKYGFPNSPPVPVEMVAEALFGLRRESGRFDRWNRQSLGGLCVDDRIVFVDDRFHWSQQIFGVAHEIGHWVLHEGRCCSELHLGGTPSIPLRHVVGSMSARTRKRKARLRETEANRLAEALLIPRSFLFSMAKGYDVIDATAIRELATAFHVSMQAMLYRIKNLWNHLAWSGARIDWDSLYWLESALGERWQTAQQAATYSDSPMSRSTVFACLTAEGEHSATRYADYLREQRREQVAKTGVRKPLILEFAGTPNAGKDTLIRMIREYLEDMCGHKVRILDEGIKSCHSDTELDKELDLDRLYKATALAVLQVYEASTENPGNYDFVILNRGLLDLLAWLHTAQLRGRISEEQEHIHRDYILSYAHLQDISFLFLTSADDSLRREENESMRSIVVNLAIERGEEGAPWERETHDKQVLTMLNSSYWDMYNAYQERFPLIYLFDLVDWADASTLEQSLSGKLRGLADAILPRNSTQLPFPELFGMCYVSENSLRERIATPQGHSPKWSHQMPVQLSLPWGSMPGGTTSMRTVPRRTRATTA